MSLRPEMHGRMDPVHPCRVMPTRHCPVIYDGVCGDRPCARFESDDETPWVPEIAERIEHEITAFGDSVRVFLRADGTRREEPREDA